MDPKTSAQDVMRCELCETAVVQMHCDTCLVNLCKACVGEHATADLSTPHKIVDFKNKKSTPLYPGCVTHVKERCKMFCKQCGIHLCTKCLSSDQHLGHKLSEISQVLDETKDNIIKEQTELKGTIYPTYQEIASDVQNRISQLEKEYADLSTAITQQRKDWHRKIDKLVNKLEAEVDKTKNTQLHTLQKHLDEIKQGMSEIRKQINLLEVALDSQDISVLFSLKFNTEEYRKLPQRILPSVPIFTPEKFVEDEVLRLFGALSVGSLTSDAHGYSINITQKSPEAGSSPSVKHFLDEPEIVTTIDTGYEFLYKVVCLNDEEIWISKDCEYMRLININGKSGSKTIKSKSGDVPRDIAVTKSGDLVYTDYNDRTVNIVKNEKIEEVIRLQNWLPCSVCSTSSGDLLVILKHCDDYIPSKVVRYNNSSEIQSIQFDDEGNPLYSDASCIYITENRNLDICVSDCATQAVVVVNKAGKLRFIYIGQIPAPKNLPFCPRGISTDSQSHILTADSYNQCVHILDQDGQFLRYIMCGLCDPRGLCTDTNDNLFVAELMPRLVKKIKYLQ
ncbi:uncharacterized protein LOC133178130 [Saccostrea echinata]|uniref:uncharacterized protein LOC133178130 n=1 Tax=Saccostrea echinata TaxID=191078 RepID=UPI002A7EB2E1|nr:uncharacterized protein LOC133178130 [Saccostrea echinata]